VEKFWHEPTEDSESLILKTTTKIVFMPISILRLQDEGYQIKTNASEFRAFIYLSFELAGASGRASNFSVTRNDLSELLS
jgi:hypothetical protein